MKRFYIVAAAAAMALGLAGAPEPVAAAPTSPAAIGLDRPASAIAGGVEQVHWRRHRRHRGVFLYFGPPRHYYRPYYVYKPRRCYRYRHYRHRPYRCYGRRYW